jgi:hypothetical protein
MQSKTLIFIIGGLTAIACMWALYLYILSDEPQEPFASKVSKPISRQTNTAQTNSNNQTTTAQQIRSEELIKEQFAEQIANVVTAFEQQAKYPVYSVLVTDPELALPIPPFEQAKVTMPTFSQSGQLQDISISASVDKLKYVMGDDITILLQVAGANATTSIFASANVKSMQGESLLPRALSLSQVGAQQTEFRASTSSNTLSLEGAAQELIVRIEIELDGQDYVTTVPFFLSQASAMIESVGRVEQEDEHLLIPLQYDVYESGYFFVSAYLDDAATGRPLVSLQGEGRLTSGSDELVLKAHHQALKDAGSEGPYKLRVTHAFRGAEDGEMADMQTAISQTQYDIPDFSFDGYADTPYANPIVEEQLEALKQLAGQG